MKIHLDEKTDALYLRFDDCTIIESEEVAPGIVLDYHASEKVVGIEAREAKSRGPIADLRRIQVEVA